VGVQGGRAGSASGPPANRPPTARQPPARPPPQPPGNGNVRIWGTSPESIDRAEDRDRWMEVGPWRVWLRLWLRARRCSWRAALAHTPALRPPLTSPDLALPHRLIAHSSLTAPSQLQDCPGLCRTVRGALACGPPHRPACRHATCPPGAHQAQHPAARGRLGAVREEGGWAAVGRWFAHLPRWLPFTTPPSTPCPSSPAAPTPHTSHVTPLSHPLTPAPLLSNSFFTPCSSEAEAFNKANNLGYPVMIRPR
jgi:hypothetical protein